MPFDQVNVESQRTRNLKAACAMITPVERWCTGMREWRVNGVTQNCALGALDRVILGRELAGWDDAARINLSPEVRLLAQFTRPGIVPRIFASARSPGSLAGWKVAAHNNTMGHAATLKMFHDAISESIRLDALAAVA